MTSPKMVTEEEFRQIRRYRIYLITNLKTEGEPTMSENRLPEPSEPIRRISEPPVVEYFHPREHAILAEYLEMQNKLPEDCRDIDPFEIVPHEDEYNEAENGIVCRPGRGGRSENETLSNAVARIALAPIRSKLPIWGTVKDGEVIHSRQLDHAGDLPQRGYRSDPVLVVSINWADSGPGYSWPVYYYISWIPFYDLYVVTASYDSDDIEGYLDVAIGILEEGAEVETDLKRVITGHWGQDSSYLQGWADCLDSGIVKDPWAWRSEISWGYDDNGEEVGCSDEDWEE